MIATNMVHIRTFLLPFCVWYINVCYICGMKKADINKKRKELGGILKKERLLKDYSLRQAADLCKTDHQRIMDVEAGKNFTLDTLIRLCSLYDLQVSLIQDVYKPN